MPDQVLDKGAVAPRVTWGFAILIATGLIAATLFGGRMGDVADRQTKYIARRDAQHATQAEQMVELRELLHSVELSFTEEHGRRPR